MQQSGRYPIFAHHVRPGHWRAYTDAPAIRAFACIIQRKGGPPPQCILTIDVFIHRQPLIHGVEVTLRYLPKEIPLPGNVSGMAAVEEVGDFI